MSGRLRAVVLVAIALGIFFRFYHLDRKVYWEDELFGTVHMLGYTEAQIVADSASLTDGAHVQIYFRLPRAGAATPDSLANTVSSLAAEDSQHPPLYYVLGHVWVEAFGSSARAIRALSAAIGVLAIPAAFWLALELFGSRRTAWIAAALVALSPFDVLYAQEAREYALWTVVVLVASAALLRACRLGTPAWWAAYGLSIAIGCYVYPLTLLVLGCHALYVLVSPELRTKRVLAPFAIASGAAVAAFAPWLRLIAADLWQTRGVPRGMAMLMTSQLSPSAIALTFLRNLRQVFLDFGRFSFGGVSSTAVNSVTTLIVAALAVAAFVSLRRSGDVRATRFLVIGLALGAVPLLAHDAAFGGKLVDQSRYFIPTYIAAELAVAAFLGSAVAGTSARPRLRAAALVALLAGEGLSCAISSQAPTWWNKDYEVSRDVAAVVNASTRPLVVSDFDTSRLLGLSYYLDPAVALRVRLRCDLCRDPAPRRPPADLLANDARYDHVFLLEPAGPSPSTGTLGPRYRFIGVSVYSPSPTALGMFLPI